VCGDELRRDHALDFILDMAKPGPIRVVAA
jgi:hypothetical protein